MRQHGRELRRGQTRRSPAVGAAILALSLCALASAQTCQPGELRVLVKDSQEAPIYDAKVRLGRDATEFATQSTPASGLAEFENVPCGAWTIKATKDGFEDSSLSVEITGEPTADVIVTMNPKISRSTLEVTDTPPPVEQSSSQNYELHPSEVKTLPTNPATVSDVLPLVPGVVRSPGGELKLDGSGEQRSSLVVNQSDVTDPATGKFGQTVPVDSIETVNVLNTPFLAQYGRFTQSVVAVETRRGGDKWHYDLNDPFPDFFVRSDHVRGIRNETPRAVAGGPLIKDRLFVISALQYILDKNPSRTLPFPFNVSKHERVNSFTQVDYILSQRQIVNATFHFNPEHTNFVNPDYFNPEQVDPSYAQRAYEGTLAHHLGLWGGTTRQWPISDSTLSSARRARATKSSRPKATAGTISERRRATHFGGNGWKYGRRRRSGFMGRISSRWVRRSRFRATAAHSSTGRWMYSTLLDNCLRASTFPTRIRISARTWSSRGTHRIIGPPARNSR
jgi:hypothetical protein